MRLNLLLVEHRNPPCLSRYATLALPLGIAEDGTLPTDGLRAFQGEEYQLLVVPENDAEREALTHRITLYVNYESVNLWEQRLEDDGAARLTLNDARSLFSQSLGFARLSLKFTGTTLHAPLLAVMTGSSREALNIEKICGYVTEHAGILSANRLSELLRCRATSIDAPDDDGRRHKLLMRIVNAYVRALSFFRSSASCTYAVRDECEPLERAGSLSEASLIHTLTHPEELFPTSGSSALSFRGRRYLPKRVLNRRQVLSRDCYENRVILSFIGTLCRFGRFSQEQKDSPITTFKTPSPIGNFVFSGSAALICALSSRDPEGAVVSCRESLTDVYAQYRKILHETRESPLRTLPRPSKRLLEIPQYREIYELMRHWFDDAPTQAETSDFLFNVTAKNLWYEYYCLIKLTLCLCDHGLSLISSSHVNWDCHARYYEDPTFDNRYDFAMDDLQVTLYYQPVLRQRITKGSDLMLLRTSSWHPNEGGLEAGNPNAEAVYTPDYVLRFTAPSGHSGYLIMDAKYASRDHATRERLPEAVLKYAAAVSLANPGDEHLGVLLLCGKLQDTDHHLHDLEAEETVNGRLPLHLYDVLQFNECDMGFDAERVAAAIMTRMNRFRG